MNWGKGLTIVIIIFLFAILMMVFTVSNQRIDLVTEDYYPKEIIYQQNIEKQKNYLSLKEKPTVKLNKNRIYIAFPASILSDSIRGTVFLYRPSDKFLDREFALELNENLEQQIDVSGFKSGKYEVIIDWTLQDTGYYVKSTLVL